MKRKRSPISLRRSIPCTSTDTKQLIPPTNVHAISPGSTSNAASPALLHSHMSNHNSSNSSEEHQSLEDVGELECSGYYGNGADQAGGDEADHGSSSAAVLQRTRAAIEQIQQKIHRTKELIKSEQNNRDENVNEYLKLASNASDKVQLQRIKSVFEKKNQKSAQTISQLQKKLDVYNKRIRDLETHGLSHWQPREVLRDVGQGLKDVKANIKGGISGLSGTVMSKPREFAHLLKNRFGSADNITTLSKHQGVDDSQTEEKVLHGSATFTHSTKYTSEEESSSITSDSGPRVVVPSPQHGSTSVSQPPEPNIPTISLDIEHFLAERRDEFQRLTDEVETVKSQFQQECTYFQNALQEERYRYERLEEQMNDLIELHQNEIENLKQGIVDMEEKVQYQSEERLRDVHDILESCQTRVSRMEHQQHQHLQQLVTLDSLENSTARPLVLKLINIALTVLQVVLLLVSTVANILTPFLRTRGRLLSTIGLVVAAVVIGHRWPEVKNHLFPLLLPPSQH